MELKLVHDFTSIIITSNSATRKCATWGKQQTELRPDSESESQSDGDGDLCRQLCEAQRQTTWKWAFPLMLWHCAFWEESFPFYVFLFFCFCLPFLYYITFAPKVLSPHVAGRITMIVIVFNAKELVSGNIISLPKQRTKTDWRKLIIALHTNCKLWPKFHGARVRGNKVELC